MNLLLLRNKNNKALVQEWNVSLPDALEIRQVKIDGLE